VSDDVEGNDWRSVRRVPLPQPIRMEREMTRDKGRVGAMVFDLMRARAERLVPTSGGALSFVASVKTPLTSDQRSSAASVMMSAHARAAAV
jgi:hypothetical protein